MRIEYLLFLTYLVMIFWQFPKLAFIKNAHLSIMETRLLLAFKIVMAIACAFYFGGVPPIGDYLSYNTEGKIQYELLLSDPLLFFTDFRKDMHTFGLGGLFDSSNSFWAFLRFNLLFKFIALLNIITRGNFYFNSAIFSSIIFFGHIAFYRIYRDIYKGNKWKILFVCFFLPSLLLYTACVHKDGVVFLSIGMVSFIFYSVIKNPKSISIQYVMLFVAGMATIFLLRNYVLVALIPAMLTGFLSRVIGSKKRVVFFITYAFYFAVFFLSGYTKSFLNLPFAVVKRKLDFSLLGEANTNIPMNELQPTLMSFIANLPQAINHALFRPYLWEFSNTGVILTALELIFYQLILLVFLLFRKKPTEIANSFTVFGYAFFINMILIIGYTIPNIGAIVRYRSIVWIFLICPLMCNIDFKKLIPFSYESNRGL